MEDKIDKIDLNKESISFKGDFHFLNEDDFKKLCDKLYISSYNTNIINIGTDVYIRFIGDLSDLGNELGVKIGDYIDNSKLGYEKVDFIVGFNHGVSIIDGTHG